MLVRTCWLGRPQVLPGPWQRRIDDLHAPVVINLIPDRSAPSAPPCIHAGAANLSASRTRPPWASLRWRRRLRVGHSSFPPHMFVPRHNPFKSGRIPGPLSPCASVPLSFCLCLSVSLSLCLFVSLSLCLSVSLSLCLSVCLSICLSVSQFLCLSVSLSLCLSCLSVWTRSVCLSA